MILISREKCIKEIEIDVDTEKEFLLQQISDEEAKREKVDIYINRNWNYIIGGEIVNFIFLRIDAFPIYEKNEQMKEVIYEADLLISQEIVTIQITQEEFYDEKWLRKIKALELLLISKRSYQKLIHAIKPRLKDNFFFENIGMHKLESKYYYAMSNCALTSDGLKRDIKAIQRNFDFFIDENIDEERCAKRFLDYNMMNLRVFFPIHCISIIAILRYFLKEQGIPAGVVLWIGGNVGSGKTTLSVCLGDYFNRTGEWNDTTKNLYSTKMKIKDVVKKLVEYQNAVLILDDIKKEETVRNKENAKNVTDLIIRSIYSGKIEQEGIDTNEVNATAIITGEFFKEQMSTVSRILYLNIGAFVEEKDNSKALIRLQDDKTYFADFMYFFIKWLLKKQEMEQYSETFSEKINEIKYKLENKFVGTLSRRMIETVSNFHLCSEILTEYFINTFKNGKYKEDIEEFEEKSKDVIYELGVATWNKSLDYSPVIVSSFLETLFDSKIKDCRYGNKYLSAIKNEHYIEYRMEKDKRGVSYNERTTNKEKLWLLNLEADYSGILLNFGKEDILLLNKIKLCDKIKKKVEEYKINWNEEFYNSDYVDEKILAGLVKEHKIYVHKRSDGAFDKIVNYPQIQMIQENGYYEVESVEKVPMVRINVDSVNNLIKNFMKNDIMCMVEPDIIYEKIISMGRVRTMDEKSIDFEKTIREINRLLDLR